jgi:hypothetical protein
MHQLVADAGDFILQSRIGDEMTARDQHGHEIGGVRIIAPVSSRTNSNDARVQLTIGLPTGFIDAAPRIRRLLQRAYRQFMPKAVNVILICTAHPEDRDDFESALLGTHIERWDAFPPRGQRVAYGRDVDGFWSEQRFAESRFAGWCHFTPRESQPHGAVWMRSGSHGDPQVRAAIMSLFEEKSG